MLEINQLSISEVEKPFKSYSYTVLVVSFLDVPGVFDHA